MRDIRDDLKERLAGLRSERDRLQSALESKLAEIAAYEQHLSALLDIEEHRAVVEQPTLAFEGFEATLDRVAPVPELSVSAKDKFEVG